MARSSKFRHNPDLDKADVTDPLHSSSSPDTDIIVINDGRVGINLPRNKIGSLGSRDPEHTLHVSGDVNIEGPAEIGGDISGNKNLKIKEDATISGDLSVSGDFKTSGSIDASGDITTLGKITTMGDLDVGGDIKTTGEWDVSGNVRFHADVFVKDDLRVSGDFHVEEDYVVGKPTSGMLASFSGDQITFGEKESGQLAEFDTGIRFFVRPTVSGTGVLLEGEGGTMGSSTISDLAVQNDLVVSGNLFVSGETTVQNVTDVSVTGDISGHTGRFKKIFVDGNEVIDVSDTGNFYPKSNPSGFITGIETGGFVTTGYSGLVEIASGNFTKSLTISGNPVLTGTAGGGSTSPFCFFYDAINHNGIIQKTYYEARVPGKENLMLSGITVDDASDLTLKLRFDGPDDDYVGTASINSSEIPTGNLSEHSADTRRFNGFIRGDFGGLNGFVTGLANGRNSVLTLNELGGGPEATALYIDEIANSTPKAGHAKGTTALKEDDSINVFAEFDTNDVTGIKVDGFGLAKGISYTSYSLTDIGGGKYKATIPVTVSSLTGPQSVRIQAKNSFGTEGGAVLSSGPSGQRTLDPLYPSIDANINYLNDWKSSQQGLGWDAVSSDAVSGRYSLSITNFSNGVDLFTGSLGEDSSDDRVLFTDSAGSSLGRSTETYASNLNVLFNTGYAGVRDNKYDSSFKMIVAVQRVSNGAKVSKNSPLQIHNSPQVLTDGKLDLLAFRAQSPHIIGQSEYKQGDLVSGEFTIYTKGASTSDIKYKVDQTQGWGSGPTTPKAVLSPHNESNAGQYNSFIDANVTGQVGNTSSSLTDLYINFTNNSSNIFDNLSYPATGSTVVNNTDVPGFTISSIAYPVNQAALKSSEVATVNHTKNSHVDVTAYGNSTSSTQGQLSITNPNTFEAAKTVSRAGGDYNVTTNNFTISGTKNSNGMVSSSQAVVRIANSAPQYSINNLNPISTTSGSAATDNFTLTANQVLGISDPLLDSSDPTDANDPSVTKLGTNTLTLQGDAFPNLVNYRLSAEDSTNKGLAAFSFTGTGIGGQVVTSINTNPNYSISGFTEREIYASPQSLGAGLAYLGTNVVDPNNVSMENISESIGGGVGKSYSYKSYANGTQMTATIDFDDQFTITNSAGETNTTGDYIYNLDKANRAGNAVAPGALYKVKED